MLTSIVIGVVGVFVLIVVVGALCDKAETSTAAAPPSNQICELKISPNGREKFTPVLQAGYVYCLKCIGIYYGYERLQADGAYHTDRDKNFTARYHGLCVNNESIWKLDSFQQDRCLHEYTALLEGNGERVAIRLHPPGGHPGWGELWLTVELLPVGTQTAKAAAEAAQKIKAQADEAARQAAELQQQQTEAARAAAEAQAEAQRRQQQQQEQAKRQHEHIMKRVRELSLIVHQQRHFLDPNFCTHFVLNNQEEVLGSVGQSWKTEHAAIVSDAELAAALRQHAPEVLDFYERRVDMVILAMRLQTLPLQKPDALQTVVPITYRTIGNIENGISELFSLREEYDRLGDRRARTGKPSEHRKQQDQVLRDMDYQYGLLNRYGIDASTPEEAEAQLRKLCPTEPVKTLYDKVLEKIEAGEQVGLDVVKERVKDLYAEQCILVGHRRRAIRNNQTDQQRAYDHRLEQSRDEFARLKDFLHAHGEEVQLGHTEQETTLEDNILGLFQEKQRLKQKLEALGDPQAAEAIEGLYAEQAAGLFKSSDDEDYT